MMSTVVGGAMLPHAPQFFTMPDTEDKDLVAHVRQVAADVGEKLRALKPDLWIIFSNDHAEQFFHTTAPPFTVHVGGEATGDFAGRKFHWKIPSEIGFEIVRQLYRQNFDPAFTSTAKIDYAIGIPLTHLGHKDPVLPIYVNAYLPPQPTMERCCACAAGALGERKPDIVSMDPSWHHNYASLAWTGGQREEQHAAHYPSIKPELVELTSALHGLAHDAELRAQYLADAPAFADKFQLPPDQREALIKLDMPSIVKMGAHPLVPFLAQLQIQRLRPRQ